ncbi:MAG TPA: hypothetical protein PKA64_13900 [Myxococcota bacterium]|nr:hypothetical protein [Myxococcota bacterium]
MAEQGVARRAAAEIKRTVVGVGRRAARLQAGFLRFQQAQVKLGEQQLQAALAVQRITGEVTAELITRLQQRWIDRLERLARAEAA